MKKKDLHPLDKIAIEWEKEEESFFLDVDFSNDFVQIKLPVAKKRAWQVKDHDILESSNLVEIYDKFYRQENNEDFIPYFDMISDIFKIDYLPPYQIDLGEVIIYPNEELTDIISGFDGNFGGMGWLMSDKAISQLENFNIGQSKIYSVLVKHKGKTFDNYKYLRFINYGDSFVDFNKSNFFKQEDYLNFDSREILKAESFDDIDSKRKSLNKKSENLFSIEPKEIFMKPNNLDLFSFSKLHTIDIFCSIKLAEKLKAESITGFKYIRTTKVKNC